MKTGTRKVPGSDSGEIIWEASWLQEKARHSSASVRLWALNRLSYCYPESPITLDTARFLLEDSDTFVRQNAISVLGNYGTNRDRKKLKKLYPDAQPAQKGALLRALARLGDSWIMDIGEEILEQGSFNINLVLTYIEALGELESPDAREEAKRMFENTRLEAVFSSLLPLVLEDANPENLRWIVDQILHKLAENYMIKIRSCRKKLQEHLLIPAYRTPVRNFLEGTTTAREFANSVRKNPYFPEQNLSLPEELQTAVNAFDEGNFARALETLGTRAKSEQETGQNLSPTEKRHLSFCSAFADLSTDFLETDVPGNPVRELFTLVLLTYLHYVANFDPKRLLQQARDKNRTPDSLLKLNDPMLFDEICREIAEIADDMDPFLDGASQDTNPCYRAKCIRILALRKEEEGLPLIVEAINSDHPLVYETAADSLLHFVPECLEELDRRLDDESLQKGAATAADVLRRIPIKKSADIFLKHLNYLVRVIGPDPILPFSVDLAIPETAEAIRNHLDRDILLAGEQLGIVADIYDLKYPEREEIEEKMEQKARSFQGGPEMGGSLPGMGNPPIQGPGSSGGNRPEPGQ